jgi:cytochrome c biogenesis protein CcdA
MDINPYIVGVAALIDSINPCAFGVLLLTIEFLLSIGKTRREVILVGSSYISGIFVAYFLIGLGLLHALYLFNTPHFMAKVGAVIVLAFGLIGIIGEFFPSFPIRFKIPHGAHSKMAALMSKASIPTALVLGGFVGLVEFPCTGGPYLMILGLLHDAQTYTRGFAYLIFYNLIFILPLVAILLFASNESFLQKFQEWKKKETGKMKLWGGVAMVLLGIIILLFY